LKIWDEVSSKSKLSNQYRQLGRTFLHNQKAESQRDKSSNGLLTGPQFSHVIANLLLDEIDSMMYTVTSGNYWRYVDDIVFVGAKDDVYHWREILKVELGKLNLQLHTGDKDFKVSCSEWLTGEHDFEQNIGIDWVSFIADTKRFLVANPNKYKDLERAYDEKKIRLPLKDYSTAIQESSFLENFQFWLGRYRWSLGAVKKIDINYLTEAALSCKESLFEHLERQLQTEYPLSSYQRKRQIPKLRYLAGRLIFLLNDTELINIAKKLKKYPELQLITSTMRTVATREVSETLAMGTNATQSAAQVLRLSREPVSYDHEKLSSVDAEVVQQSLAVLSFSGVNSDHDQTSTELLKLAHVKDLVELMNSENKFVKEFACLHGNYPSRHSITLNTAFDKDEDLALDVLNHMNQSSHC